MTAIGAWVKDIDPSGTIKENDLYGWASDACNEFITADMMLMGISLLDIREYKAVLPKGFKSMNLAMYTSCQEKCLREEVVEWTSQIYGSKCNLKVNLECPSCGSKSSCGCERDSKAVLIDVDRIISDARPGMNMGNTNLQHQTYTTAEYKMPKGISRFKLMRPSLNYNFNAYHTKGCPNLNFSTKVEYTLRNGIIETNFRTGQVLLSYMCYAMDENGELMIPDDPKAYAAVVAWIEERLAYRKYRQETTGQTRTFWSDTLMVRDKAIGMARSKLGILDPDLFYATVKNHWLKMIPNWHSDYNFNESKDDEYKPYEVQN